MIDRTPETALDLWFTFDGLVPGEVGNWIVSLQNYAVAVDVCLGLLAGLRGLFRQDDALVFSEFSRLREHASG